MTTRPPDLPDAFVGLGPHVLDVLDEDAGQVPHVVGQLVAEAVARVQEHVHDLAVHIELELLARGVADAHRRRILVAGQPVELHLLQSSFAADAVHDLHLLGAAGHGSPEPVAPRHGLVAVPGVAQRGEREGRVAQPAVPVVPVAHAAEPLRQRRGGRRDHPAGRSVGERLQREQRPQHDVLVVARVACSETPSRSTTPSSPPTPRTGRSTTGRACATRTT